MSISRISHSRLPQIYSLESSAGREPALQSNENVPIVDLISICDCCSFVSADTLYIIFISISFIRTRIDVGQRYVW
jgi:hypothetical protein